MTRMDAYPLSLVPKKSAPAKESTSKEELDAKLAAYDERRKVEDAMVNFIAHHLASPRVPHYDHVRHARDALRHLQAVATVTPNIRRLEQYGFLKEGVPSTFTES